MLKPQVLALYNAVSVSEEALMKRTLMALMVSLLALGLLAGCNTVAGFGKDMQKAGDKLEGAAKR